MPPPRYPRLTGGSTHPGPPVGHPSRRRRAAPPRPPAGRHSPPLRPTPLHHTPHRQMFLPRKAHREGSFLREWDEAERQGDGFHHLSGENGWTHEMWVRRGGAVGQALWHGARTATGGRRARYQSPDGRERAHGGGLHHGGGLRPRRRVAPGRRAAPRRSVTRQRRAAPTAEGCAAGERDATAEGCAAREGCTERDATAEGCAARGGCTRAGGEAHGGGHLAAADARLGCGDLCPECHSTRGAARSPRRLAALTSRGGARTIRWRVRPPLRGCSSVGRALPSHGRGQGFDSPHLHQN